MKPNIGKRNDRLVTTKNIFVITLIVMTLTILFIWLFGLGQHRTIFVNSIYSTSLLSISFFFFISIGLYKGIKLKDNLGEINSEAKIGEPPSVSNGFDIPTEFPVLEIGAEAGIEGLIFGILAWIVFSIAFLFLVWFFGAIAWVMVLGFIAMLYWVFYRALRLVFKNSKKSKGSLTLSLQYAAGYTLLYNFWIYGIILASHYLVK